MISYIITWQITFNLIYKLLCWQSEQSYCRQLIPHHWQLMEVYMYYYCSPIQALHNQGWTNAAVNINSTMCTLNIWNLMTSDSKGQFLYTELFLKSLHWFVDVKCLCRPWSSLIHFACIGVAPPRLVTSLAWTVKGEQLQCRQSGSNLIRRRPIGAKSRQLGSVWHTCMSYCKQEVKIIRNKMSV